MSLRFRLTLKDSDDNPVRNATVKLYLTEIQTQEQSLKQTGTTNARGQVTVALSNLKYLPHFRVTYTIDNQERDLPESSYQISRRVVDLGTQQIDTRDPDLRPIRDGVIERVDGPVVQPQPVPDLRLKETLTRVTREKEMLKQEILQLRQRVEHQARNFEILENQFRRDEQQRQARHEAELERKDQQVNELHEQLEAMSVNHGADVSINNLVSRTSLSLDSARKTLEEQDSGFTLGNVTMRVKGLAGQGGNGISFVARDQLAEINTNAFSEIIMEFERPQPRQTPPSNEVTVPDLTGYTERMAARMLRKRGLKVDTEHEAVIDAPGQPSNQGRVVAQEPVADTRLPAGSQVLIAIGKRLSVEDQE